MKKTFISLLGIFILALNVTHAQLPIWTIAHQDHATNPKKGEIFHPAAGGAKAQMQNTNTGVTTPVKRFNAISQAIALPFKVRPQDGIWESGFSLGNATGFHVLTNTTKQSTDAISLLGYAGASTLTMDATNSKNTSSTTRVGSTLAIVAMYEFSSLDDLQLGFTLGWDFDPKNTTDNWKYNGKPWLSFGIGISIFKSSSN